MGDARRTQREGPKPAGRGLRDRGVGAARLRQEDLAAFPALQAQAGRLQRSVTMTKEDAGRAFSRTMTFGYDLSQAARAGGDLTRLEPVTASLSKIERQYMLVNVADRTQASRVQAMLDSYIQAQVLAINAQLNFNSAEQENAKILDTLKASLQGVVTEFDRLVARQSEGGGLGRLLTEKTGGRVQVSPEAAMKGGLAALQSVMRLFNTGLGSTVLAGLLGLVTALGARLAIIAVQGARAAAASGEVAGTVNCHGPLHAGRVEEPCGGCGAGFRRAASLARPSRLASPATPHSNHARRNTPGAFATHRYFGIDKPAGTQPACSS